MHFILLLFLKISVIRGFVGKWQIFKAALESDIWYILIVSVAMLFTFSYAFKFVELLVVRKREKDVQSFLRGELCLGVITLITILNLYIGINHQFLLNITNQIAQMIIK